MDYVLGYYCVDYVLGYYCVDYVLGYYYVDYVVGQQADSMATSVLREQVMYVWWTTLPVPVPAAQL